MKYPGYILRLGGPVIKNYFWIRKYARHPERYTTEEKYQKTRVFLDRVLKGLRVEFHVEGLENIPQGEEKYLITPNHQSFLDPFFLFHYFDAPMTFIAKKEIQHYPIVRRVITILGSEYMDRNDLRQSLKVIRKVATSLQNNEVSWAVFPEGHRTKNENYEMNDFKPGTFKIALDSQKAIVPVAIYGGFRPLNTKYKNKISPVQIAILPPIPYEEYRYKRTLEIAQMVEERVKNKVEELRKNDAALLEEANRKKKKRSQ